MRSDDLLSSEVVLCQQQLIVPSDKLTKRTLTTQCMRLAETNVDLRTMHCGGVRDHSRLQPRPSCWWTTADVPDVPSRNALERYSIQLRIHIHKFTVSSAEWTKAGSCLSDSCEHHVCRAYILLSLNHYDTQCKLSVCVWVCVCALWKNVMSMPCTSQRCNLRTQFVRALPELKVPQILVWQK